MDVSIRIKGHLDPGLWQDYLDGLQIIHENDGVSRLCGTLPDQPALYGVLKKLAHLSVTLLSLDSDEDSKRQKENIMRKVILGMNVTLDGYVAGPNGELDWAFRTMSPDMGEWITQLLRGVDTTLLGHTTYLQQAATWPTQTGEMADLLNSHTKVVFSTRLTTLEWNNSRLATSSAAEEIARLKQQPGKDISVSGGATLAQSLSRMGLIDEYNLVMHPVVLGSGKPLFADLSQPLTLKLESTKTFASGAIGLTYQLVRE